MFDPKPLLCEQCGGQIDRATRKCPYCGTQYELPEGVKVVIDRPGVHRIRCEARLDEAVLMASPEVATEMTLQQMRKQVADSLLAYMEFVTEVNPMSMHRIIRGEIRVLEPGRY